MKIAELVRRYFLTFAFRARRGRPIRNSNVYGRFLGASRNKECPCGSGVKFKRCCRSKLLARSI